MSDERKSVDEFLVKDLDKLSKNEIMLNIKALVESYMSQASVAEKILIEFTKTRRIIELFLIEYIKRGGDVDELSEEVAKLQSQMEDAKNLTKKSTVEEKTKVRFGETKFQNGERF